TTYGTMITTWLRTRTGVDKKMPRADTNISAARPYTRDGRISGEAMKAFSASRPKKRLRINGKAAGTPRRIAAIVAVNAIQMLRHAAVWTSDIARSCRNHRRERPSGGKAM